MDTRSVTVLYTDYAVRFVAWLYEKFANNIGAELVMVLEVSTSVLQLFCTSLGSKPRFAGGMSQNWRPGEV